MGAVQPGGIGKSELAIAFANSHIDDFSLVWFISAETKESAYHDLAGALSIVVDKTDSFDVVSRKVHRKLENLNAKPWLLIFDNFDEQITYPQRGGTVLITTRSTKYFTNTKGIKVPVMDEQEALELICKATGESESDEMKELANRLGYYPILLDQAAGYIESTPGMTVKTYLETIEDRLDFSRMKANTRYEETLKRIFEITFPSLPEYSRQWLSVCGYLDCEIPKHYLDVFLEIGVDANLGKAQRTHLLEDVIATLQDQGLISYDADAQMITIHRMFQEILQEVENEEGFQQALKLIIHMSKKLEVGSRSDEWMRHVQELRDSPQFRRIEKALKAELEDAIRSIRVTYSFENCVHGCQEGDLKQVKAWIAEDPKRKTARTERKKTLLHFAAEAGENEIVSYLLQDNALLNLTDQTGRSAFHYAAENGHVEVGKILHSKKPDFVRLATRRGLHPIHLAARGGHLNFVKWLHEGDSELIKVLSEYQSSKGWSTLHFAVCSNEEECIKWVFDHFEGMPIAEDGKNPFHIAASHGQAAAIRTLIGKCNAGEASFLDSIKALLKKDIPLIESPDLEGNTPLHLASEAGQESAIQVLIEEGHVSIQAANQVGYLPIHLAAKSGSLGAVRLLLDHGSAVDPRGAYERTPLHMAAFQGHVLAAEELLNREANINAQVSPYLTTALHDSVVHGDINMVKLLLSPSFEEKMDVNVKDQIGHTALWEAVCGGHIEMIPLIMQHPSFIASDDVNSLDNLCIGKDMRKNTRFHTDAVLREKVKAALEGCS